MMTPAIQHAGQPIFDSRGEGFHSGRLRDRLVTPGGAFALAWSIWFTYLVLPLFVFFGTVIYLLVRPSVVVQPELGQSWFFVMMVMIAAGVPLIFLLRSKVFFYGYRTGRSATPAQYIGGMIMVWTWIELVGVLSLVGCIVTGDLVPNIIPALFAFVLYVTQWPNASAMANHTGHLEDPSLYLHPR